MRYVVYSPALGRYLSVESYVSPCNDTHFDHKELRFVYGTSDLVMTFDSKDKALAYIAHVRRLIDSQLWPNVHKGTRLSIPDGFPEDLEIKSKIGKLIDSNPYSFKTDDKGEPINVVIRRTGYWTYACSEPDQQRRQKVKDYVLYYKGKGNGILRVTSSAWTDKYEEATKFTEAYATQLITALAHYHYSLSHDDIEPVVIYNDTEVNERTKFEPCLV